MASRADGRLKNGVIGSLLMLALIAPASGNSPPREVQPSNDGYAREEKFVLNEVIVLSSPPNKATLPADTVEKARLKLLYCVETTGDCVYSYPPECGACPDEVAARLNQDIMSCRASPGHRDNPARRPGKQWQVIPNAILTMDQPQEVAASAYLPIGLDPDEFLVKQTELQRIGAKAAWSDVSPNSNIITAVIDTGIQLDHPDLAPNLLSGTTIPCRTQPCDGGATGLPHGTSMAGTIAAARFNGGIVGMAWNTLVLPIKATNEFGQSNDGDASKAIEYALSHGARVLNLSFNSDAPTTAIKRVLDSSNRPFLLMVPAGNNPRDLDAPGQHSYPASLKDKQRILAVMSHDDQDRRESTSGWGKETVDIAAPGAMYSSKICTGTACYSLSKLSTSNATSYVSGAAALLWSRYPDWHPADIRWRILENAKRAEKLVDFLDPPRRLDLERMMFPVRFIVADADRRIHRSALQAVDLTQQALPAKFDLSTTFPPGMCKSTTVDLIRANQSVQQSLSPSQAAIGDAIQFIATCHRTAGANYTALSVIYQVIG
jgi:hypothetical protein